MNQVVRVSADAVHDAKTGLSWYEVELAMDRPDGPRGASGGRADAPAEGEDEAVARTLIDALALTPGMPVEVHIRTDERTLMSYLVKPLSDFFQRGLREE